MPFNSFNFFCSVWWEGKKTHKKIETVFPILNIYWTKIWKKWLTSTFRVPELVIQYYEDRMQWSDEEELKWVHFPVERVLNISFHHKMFWWSRQICFNTSIFEGAKYLNCKNCKSINNNFHTLMSYAVCNYYDIRHIKKGLLKKY